MREVLEKFLYNKMFSFFIENDLVSQNQSGFKPGNSYITHESYKSFHDGWEVRGVFIDTTKAFDKVWHEGLLLKLKLNGISGKLLKIMEDFLANRYQRVVLNGKVSKSAAVKAGVCCVSYLWDPNNKNK